ncbi:myotubularin-related protein 4 isoform X1 [Spodoptera frugiperda]|uniref:phosphatidylinositol-3,5-bisphosphate 3-phosphatase n=2 Tax=Spodoptera frugiperda TaxID=7108 RepID=A0A2H1V9A1_SPOFR|nr:myotubularin-related protein 4 isoform X1 [Spodoptera frugiperda]XP_035447874.1 myotubularin-related protein 4 isoform X1 [Spodoptera frugiperda]
MLINTFLDTEDFVHLYYPEDEPAAVQGCGAGARMASKYPPRPPSPEYSQVVVPSTSEMGDRERYRAPPQPEPPPHRVRAADLYPRLRTHYDEPGLDAGFTPICGEFVQWVGRTTDGGTIAMSNYRLHVQPRRRNDPGASIPLRLIDLPEIRDLLHLIVLCKNGRQLKCSFSTGDQCIEWWRRLTTALAPIGSVQETFAAAYAAWAKEQPPTSVHRALMRASQSPQRHWFGPEVERLGFTAKNAWRVTAANAEYKLCLSYPPLLVVPASICDEDLDSVARFRAMRRIPAVVWRHRGNGAVIARSSQPEVGWLGWRSSEDERLLAAFVNACNADRGMQPPNNNNKQLKLLIVDARSYASAVTNRARGGGCECQQYYPAADIQFMCLPNIHHVRRSFQQMRALAAEPSDQANWHSNLERTLWLQYVSGVVRASTVVARAVAGGRPVLVHCSDGWDRTPQIVAAAQLILDPYYRTLEGFRILIEREWLDFGHKFADRCGHQFGPEDPNERSPIFLQWLDVVHQMMLQFPCSFEFNEAYLIKLGTHVHSCMFGTFLCNTGLERIECRAQDLTPHVWHLLRAPAYRNHLYSPHQLDQQAIWPEYSVRTMCVWSGMFCESPRDEPRAEHRPDLPPQPLPITPPHNGLMTKTRSCDNLLNEAEKRTTQRRSSDPSLAPDVMKLSMVVGGECEKRECRAALTDSCVDELPLLPVCNDTGPDTVDGLHPDHFENSTSLPRDIASGSSSLERELDGAAELTDKIIPDQVIDHTEDLTTSDNSQVNGTAGSVSDAAASAASPDVDTPEEPPVFVVDTYSDVIGMAEAARESARTRNISITWRSVSESSNQSSTGFEINEGRAEPPASRNTSHDSSPMDNHTTEDRTNHNVVTEEHTRENGVTNGTVNGIDDVGTKFLEVDLNGGATSSSISSESEGEAHTQPRRTAHTHTRTRVASQLTLCPTSPRRIACCHCSRRASNTSGIETSGESGGSSEVCWCGVCGGALGGARVRCVCGAPAPAAATPATQRADPVDGLPPALDPLQARLHQIILYQKKVVEELSGQLREAREALRLSSPPAPAPPPVPHAATPTQKTSSGSGSVRGSGSSSGSASEVEVGEEARGVVWLPDSAAPRCQYCRNHFWLARRRHHCRRCGGIFCGSCSEMSSWGDCGSMRVCRRCRALR